MDIDSSFRISDVFPATPEGAALARFLVLSRQTEHLNTALMALGAGSTGGPLEAKLMLLGCYIGSLKELADSFRHIHSQGHLEWIRTGQDLLPDLVADIDVAVRGTDRIDPTSLYSRFLKRVRDNAGFHIQLNSVLSALTGLAGASMKPAEVKDPGDTIVAIPFVELLTTLLIWSQESDVDELHGTMRDAAALHVALRNVALDLYLLRVRWATELGS